MFNNEIIRGIFISQYIASWARKGGKFYERWYYDEKGKLTSTHDFIGYLKSLVIDGEHLTDDEIYKIYSFATNGKLELEELAKDYIANNNLER